MLVATVLALAAALLHPAWNLAVKVSSDRHLALWGQFAVGGAISAVALVAFGGVAWEAWPFAVVSGVVHLPYVLVLARAYDHGDLSLAYPLARGGGALLAGLGAALILGDELSRWGWVAVAVVVTGLAGFVRPDVSRAAVGWALTLAVVIGVYTVVDAEGSRRSGGPVYVFATTLMSALAVTVHGLVSGKSRALVATLKVDGRRLLLMGAGLVMVYGLVLAAMRHAPVGYVAALRESSVVIAALAGWKLLGEPFGRTRVAASLVVLAGLVLLVFAGTT
ncbi:MAG TPA: EamA family transporter [Acidimicrobiales bacterium]